MKVSDRVIWKAILPFTLLVLALGACTSGGDTYEEFRSALESGASCNELFSQRKNFDSSRDLTRIDADLAEIGCTSPEADRTDR